MARLYANENFPLPAVEELRRLGHDVLTSYESGRAGQAIPDEDVLAFAVAEARILITLNRKHFVTIQPIEIVLPGHFVPGVGLRRHPEVGEGRPSAAGPGRLTSVSA